MVEALAGIGILALALVACLAVVGVWNWAGQEDG